MDRYVDSLIAIREEIRQIEEGTMDRECNPLKVSQTQYNVRLSLAISDGPAYASSAHVLELGSAVLSGTCRLSEAMVLPQTMVCMALAILCRACFRPSVGRIDDQYGDRNLFCTCPPVDSYA